MGGIWIDEADLLQQFVELVGFKSGVVISEERALAWLGEIDLFIQRPRANDSMIRIRSEAVEQAVAHLLYRVGNISDPYSGPPTIKTYLEFRNVAAAADVYPKVQAELVAFLRRPSMTGRNTIDPGPFVLKCLRKYGAIGGEIAMSYITNIARHQQASPWFPNRSVDWKNQLELQDLFESENLETQYGSFIDQRFIDYLDRNFDEIDAMHWRKFEGLAGEWFEREGYEVDMGPGRNDDGIDLRLSLRTDDGSKAPLLIVQCKRQKRKIEKALIKSVYADILHESAQSGVIVTTTELAPGAEALRKARHYPIQVVDRDALRTWLQSLRSALL